MSGHNRWSKIKHTKAAYRRQEVQGLDQAAQGNHRRRQGRRRPDGNPRLRTAVDKARGANVPNDTIKRAIQKGTGELAAESYEELVYEVYGPGGIAVVVEILTDNRNRTAGEIRKVLERGNAKLAAAGLGARTCSTSTGTSCSTATVGEDKLMEAALEPAPTTCAPTATVFLRRDRGGHRRTT